MTLSILGCFVAPFPSSTLKGFGIHLLAQKQITYGTGHVAPGGRGAFGGDHPRKSAHLAHVHC